MPKIIYLDNHATTPVDPRVVKAMLPYFTQKFGNAASSTHVLGREASKAVEKSRLAVARLIGAEANEIIFTSGATESNNLALKGAATAYRDKGNHILTLSTEHKSVLDSCKRLGLEGFDITYLSVKKDGLIDIEILKKAITPKTILLSVMFANNEIGVLQPIQEIGRIVRENNILFHCDAAQAVGKVLVDVKKMNMDLLSFTAHKIHGPKGIGALYIRKSEPRPRLAPMIDGGGHEGGFRSGTLNVPGIVGFAKACELSQNYSSEAKKLLLLRNRLREGIFKNLPDTIINGSEKYRLPNNLNISFPDIEAKKLLEKLPDLALSSGSACLSSSPETSYVLKAIGLPESLRASSLRFSLGRFNTKNEVDQAIRRVTKAVKELKNARS